MNERRLIIIASSMARMIRLPAGLDDVITNQQKSIIPRAALCRFIPERVRAAATAPQTARLARAAALLTDATRPLPRKPAAMRSRIVSSAPMLRRR